MVPYGARWMYSSLGTSDASRGLGLRPGPAPCKIYRWIDNVYRNCRLAFARYAKFTRRCAGSDWFTCATESGFCLSIPTS